jgi:ATP-dependent DNA helicase DinG
MPSRLLSAFPPGTPIRRLTLDEAILAVNASARAQTLGEAAALGHQGAESGMPPQETE